MKYEQLKLDNQLCFPFYAVSRLIIREYQEDLDRLGITYTQYLVMMVLWEQDGRTVNEIAHKLILNTNTVTPLLKRMEAMDLLKRTPSAADQRKVMITLTEQGRQMQEEASQIPLRLVAKLGANPSEIDMKEVETLKHQLYGLIHMLENLPGK
ncbi:MAG: MarR family transcriptional regulator [Paludibacter sp. 47-17]|nr:MAG: MarR family transcriptional regulator [Paludibacter sp. SCN 50-10]OJX90054.1 MAG: MarR family transcriptional regulator [Paludibacter sp. 47-17]